MNLDETIKNFKLDDSEKAQLADTVKKALDEFYTSVSQGIDQVSEDPDEDEDDTDGKPADKDDEKNPVKPAEAPSQNALSIRPVIKQYNFPTAKVKEHSWLESDEAMNAFADNIVSHNGADTDVVTTAWRDIAARHVSMNKATADQVAKLIPAPIVTAIDDVFNQPGRIYPLFSNIAAPSWRVIANTMGVNPDDKGRAHGYPTAKYGTAKEEQEWKVASRDIIADIVYKYITVDRGTIRKTANNRVILNYIMDELPNRIVQTIERAAIIGDYPDTANQYQSVVNDAKTANSPWATTVTADTSKAPIFESLGSAVGSLSSGTAPVLVTSRQNLNRFTFDKSAKGDYIIPVGYKISDALNLADTFTPEWWNDSVDPSILAVVLDPKEYMLVGDTKVEQFTQFALKTNEDQFLAEFLQGGALRSFKSGAVVVEAKKEPATK